jgi:hypothetical protein
MLRARPHLPGADVVAALGVSRATLMRAVRAAVFQVDEGGGSEQVGHLNLAYPDSSVFESSAPFPWPLDESMRDGWFDGLPYFLQDLRPDGLLGRRFARTHAQILQLGDCCSSATTPASGLVMMCCTRSHCWERTRAATLLSARAPFGCGWSRFKNLTHPLRRRKCLRSTLSAHRARCRTEISAPRPPVNFQNSPPYVR